MSQGVWVLMTLSFLISPTSLACRQEKARISSQGNDFMASSAVPFKDLMVQAMLKMDLSMETVNPDLSSDLQFLYIMKAHHQGAVDMSLSILTHTHEETVKNFATSVVGNQKNEIEFINAEIKRLEKRKSLLK